MKPIRSLIIAVAVLILIALPVTITLAYVGAPTFAVISVAVVIQCSALLYLLVRRKP